MKRIRYTVSWDKRAKRWIVRPGGADFKRKADAVIHAVAWARYDWGGGTPSQVLIKTKDGRYQSERTYGQDPRKTKG